VEITPPISALKVKSIADLPSSPLAIEVQNDQSRLESGNSKPSMALVVSNTGNAVTMAPYSEEDSDEEVSAVSSNSDEEEDLVSAKPNQRGEPRASLKAPSYQKNIPGVVVVTPSITGRKGTAVVTPIASHKGTNRRRPPKRR